jgi:hypothetical protein
MGLLDDAIREHLELRRLSGADPSEVASKEHEALGPATVQGEGLLPAEADPIFKVEPATIGASERAVRREDAWDSDELRLGQKTVELDMRAVLEEDLSGRVARATPEELSVMAGAASAGAAPVREHRARR